MVVLLFCIAEEAKSFAHTVCAWKDEYGLKGSERFHPVQAGTSPTGNREIEGQLNEDEAFDSDFIGATEQDCHEWARERQKHDKTIEDNLIAIVDARSAEDGTLSIQIFQDESYPEFEFGKYRVLPKECNVWHVFRVDYRQAHKAISALRYVTPETAYPIWYGHKDELTDEKGVFDVERADRVYEGENKEWLDL